MSELYSYDDTLTCVFNYQNEHFLNDIASKDKIPSTYYYVRNSYVEMNLFFIIQDLDDSIELGLDLHF